MFYFIDHMIFLHHYFFHLYFIVDKILYVETFYWFFLDHMMFLLLKLERGHLCNHYLIADNIFLSNKNNWYYFLRPHDVLASVAGAWSHLYRIFHHYFKVDKILCVETFYWFYFIDHMMFLLLKLERGHPFHHYFIAEKFTCRNNELISIYRPHDVLASVAGAWLPLSPLPHSR